MTAAAAAAATPFVGLVLLLSLLTGIGFYVYVQEVAPDGRSVIVTQDGFDGDVVDIYTEYDDFHYKWYRRAPEPAGPQTISSENCRLESSGETLLLTCGLDTVAIHSDQRPARR